MATGVPYMVNVHILNLTLWSWLGADLALSEHQARCAAWLHFVPKKLHLASTPQSGTKPNLVVKILATKIGNLWA